MGHKTSDERDEKVASMLNSVFDRLNTNSKIDIQSLRAEIETPKGGQKKTQYAYNEILPETKDKPKSDFSIQIGAFSSYDKAMSHAKNVQKQYSNKLLQKNIQIEKLNRGDKAIYRAQITGLNHSDADKLCAALKNKKQDCIASAVSSKTQFAER